MRNRRGSHLRETVHFKKNISQRIITLQAFQVIEHLDHLARFLQLGPMLPTPTQLANGLRPYIFGRLKTSFSFKRELKVGFSSPFSVMFRFSNEPIFQTNYTVVKSYSINHEININMIFPPVKYIRGRICKGSRIRIFGVGLMSKSPQKAKKLIGVA
jgi:hypothetical protein